MIERGDNEKGLFGGLNERHFKYLLLVLLFLFFLMPLVGELIVQAFPWIARLMYFFVFLATLIGAASVASRNRKVLIFVSVAIFFAVVFNGIYLLRQHDALLIANHAIIVIVLFYIIVSLTRYLFIRKKVTRYTLYASLSSYLLIALLWALIFGITDLLEPGSFRIPVEIAPDGRMASMGEAGSFHALYFSIVTLTTLGYGDISPLSVEARMLCSAEAFVGQMYVAITVARLVGIYTTQSLKDSQTQ